MKFLFGWLLLLTAVEVVAADRSFKGQASQPDAKTWRYVLTLHDEGRAVLRTIKSPQSSMTERAQWSLNETGQLSLQFLNLAGAPRGAPVVWKRTAGRLTPVTWDRADWGEVGPPALRGN